MDKYLQLLNYDNIQIKHPITKKIITLYRIIALRTFNLDDGSTIEKYNIGGYVQNIDNIDMNTYNWVDGKAKVFDSAYISSGTYVGGNALIFENARVTKSKIIDYARVYGKSMVNNTLATSLSEIRGESHVENSELYNSSLVFEHAYADQCKLFNGSNLRGESKSINCTLYDTSEVGGDSIANNCRLTGGAFFKTGTHVDESIDRDLGLVFTDPIQTD